MTDREFEERLQKANTPQEIALLTHDAIEDAIDWEAGEQEKKLFVVRIRKLLDKGLDPNVKVEDSPCIWGLQYGCSDYVLDAARMIFEQCGLPTAKDDEGEDFVGHLESNISYNYYCDSFAVKLYLLCCAYGYQDANLHFSPNLYQEMFDHTAPYASSAYLREGSQPLQLTPEIFKNIRRFDHMVEMLPQQKGYYGCWRLHIFEKHSKLEVATYG